MFRKLSRNIEWCKADCLFFTSFNEYIHFTVKLGTVPSNFVQSMKLNIDVVGKIGNVEQDRGTCIWPDIEVLDSSPTIRYFTLDYLIGIVVGHSIRPHQLREVLYLSTIHYPLSTSSILRKSDTRIPIPSVTCLGCTISIHYITS